MKVLFVIFFSCSIFFAQTSLNLNGHLQNMQTVYKQENNSVLFLTNSINNRLNFKFQYNYNFIFDLSLRNILDYGQLVTLVPNYNKIAVSDNGYLNLTKEIYSEPSFVIYSNIDRLNLFYSHDNFEIQFGRQRINLGINFVWTPNDIFNSTSFLNFDYVEKPGSDALRLQYYFGYASSVQIITKLNSEEDITAAAVLKFNKWEYDFQLMTAITDIDYVFGGGWSGQIADAGFNGEMSYFIDRDNPKNNSGVFVGSLGANYSFSNGLLLMTELLYNSNGIIGKKNELSNIFSLEYSAKNLSSSRLSTFYQIQYPITSLISLSIASIVNPTDYSFFLNPSIDFSLTENIYLLASGQFFLGEELTEWGKLGKFFYLRLKWNF